MDVFDATDSLVSFGPLTDAPGVRIHDRVDGLDYALYTDTPVTPEPTTTTGFPFPVDGAASLTASEIRLPATVGVFLRDANGDHMGDFYGSQRGVPRGTYYLDVGFASKTYIRINDATFDGYHPDTDATDAEAVFTFTRPTQIDVGVRSAHTCPSTTLTVPEDPEAMAEAFSYLGSSLKEYSCERSWPTLRGHPPAIELGDELHIPADLDAPDTGVTLVVPPTYEALYTTAPLAFYLGATVEVGTTPELRTLSGFTHPLTPGGCPLHEEVARVLAQCLLLDSLTRVGGYYSFSRYEYEELAPHLTFYPAMLYDEPIWKQVEQYLDVPFDALADHIPQWPVTATLEPDAEDVEAIPYLVNDLARIRVTEADSESLESSLYETYSTTSPPSGGGVFVREAFENRLGYDPASNDVRLTVVCNDSTQQDAVDAVVADHRARDTDITVIHDATTDRLTNALHEERSLLWFVGRVTADGFACADGWLDVTSLGTVGCKTFLLQECVDTTQSVHLARQGALGGVVLRESDHPDTERCGRVVDFVTRGYSLSAAIDIAGLDAADTRYNIIGDGGIEVARLEGGDFVYTIDVESKGEDSHEVTTTSYASTYHPLGGISRLCTDYAPDAVHLLSARVTQPLPLSTDQLTESLQTNHGAVRLTDERVYWSENISAADIRAAAKQRLDG